MIRKWKHRSLLATAIALTFRYLASASTATSGDDNASCFDDPTFRWKGKTRLTCVKIAAKNKGSRCDLTQNGIAVRESCPVSCGICSGPCFDDPTFRKKGEGCANYLKNDNNKEKRCDSKSNGIKVSEYCRATCGTCTTCDDDPTFLWEGNEGLTCEVFTETDKELQCGLQQDGIAVFNLCRATCGTCTGPSDDPSASPSATFSPSSAPSIGPAASSDSSDIPSASPSATFSPSSAPSIGPSASSDPSDIPSVSPSASFSPSSNPSIGPAASSIPSDVPSGLPSASFSPSSNPSIGPTASSDPSDIPSVSPSASFSPSSNPSIGPSASSVPSDVPSGLPSNVPPEAQFTDISEKLAKYASEELAHIYVQKPWSHFHAPMTFDVNGDGFADMLSHHHVGNYDGDAGVFWDIAISSENSNKEITYTAGKVDITYKGRIPNVSEEGSNVKYDIEPKCVEENNLTDGSIVEEFNCVDYPDFHGSAVLDFDRDGKLDMFVSIGGGGGDGTGIGVESVLFWGADEDTTNPNEAAPKSDLRFTGGRGALVDAGLSSGTPQRAYGVYLADFNNDGYLDFFSMNKYRKEVNDPDDAAPGLIFLNRGVLEPRRFDARPEVSKYASSALLTDFDQDGFANEFLIFERSCTNDEPNCTDEPRGFVYKWDATLDAFEEIWISEPFREETNLISSASGDFNGDGLTDVVILTERKKKGELQFWYSSNEPELLGSTTLVVQIPEDCQPRHSMRAGDFDLNGTLDLFVLCKKGEHKIFQQSQSDGTWSTWDDDTLGPLGDPEQNTASTQAYFDRCFGDDLDQCESDEEELETIDNKINRNSVISQGVTLFDYNNDGFLDLFLVNKNGVNTLFENKGVPGNKFVSLKLKGITSNIDGIGAVLRLTWNNGVGTEEKNQLREHNAQSFETDSFGSRDSRIVFGLGKTGAPLSLEVRWPSGLVSTLTEAMLNDTPMTMNYNEIMTVTEPE